MSSKDWKPWWEKVADIDSFHEKSEFMKGVVPGSKPSSHTRSSLILLGLVAGYIGGKAASKGNTWKR